MQLLEEKDRVCKDLADSVRSQGFLIRKFLRWKRGLFMWESRSNESWEWFRTERTSLASHWLNSKKSCRRRTFSRARWWSWKRRWVISNGSMEYPVKGQSSLFPSQSLLFLFFFLTSFLIFFFSINMSLSFSVSLFNFSSHFPFFISFCSHLLILRMFIFQPRWKSKEIFTIRCQRRRSTRTGKYYDLSR